MSRIEEGTENKDQSLIPESHFQREGLVSLIPDDQAFLEKIKKLTEEMRQSIKASERRVRQNQGPVKIYKVDTSKFPYKITRIK